MGEGGGAAEWPVGLAHNTATWNGTYGLCRTPAGLWASSRKHGSSIYVLICAPGMRFLRMRCSGWVSGAALFWPVLSVSLDTRTVHAHREVVLVHIQEVERRREPE